MARTIAVFLNRKLISCDTILPLLIELRMRAPEVEVEIWIPDRETQAAIRRNVVLFEAAERIGPSYLLSGRGNPWQMRLRHRLATALRLARLLMKGFTGKAAFIHFKALSKWPLRALYHAAPGQTFLAENDSYGFTELMSKVTFLIDEVAVVKRVPPAGHLIAFSKEWHMLAHPALTGIPRKFFGPTRLRRPWLDFIKGNADRYFDAEFARAGVVSAKEILVVMLGFFGPLAYLNESQSVEKLLTETLEELIAIAGDRPILIKPHVITDMNKLQQILGGLATKKILVTHLHPMVLAMRARVVVANYYTTTLTDCHWMGVPTIEYTHYSKRALELTGGGSMRPEIVDHFINHDRATLRSILRGLVEKPVGPAPEGEDADPEGVIRLLAGSAKADA